MNYKACYCIISDKIFMNGIDYKTRAIVVRRRNLGEFDKIIVLLTEEYGKIQVVAKGLRKTINRMSGIFEPFMVVELVLKKGKSIDSVKEAKLIGNYSVLEKSLRDFGLTSFVLEVLEELIDESPKEIYKLILDYFDCFQRNRSQLKEENKMLVFVSSFLMSVLAVSGRLPILDDCWICGDEKVDNLYLTVDGVCHAGCKKEGAIFKKIDSVTYEYLKKVQQESCDQLLRDDFDLKTMRYIFSLCLFLVNDYLNKEIRSLKFLEQVFTQIKI